MSSPPTLLRPLHSLTELIAPFFFLSAAQNLSFSGASQISQDLNLLINANPSQLVPADIQNVISLSTALIGAITRIADDSPPEAVDMVCVYFV